MKQEKSEEKNHIESLSIRVRSSDPSSTPTKLDSDHDTTSGLAGIPTYAGLSGNRLIAAVTIIATTGFTLFGYDQGSLSGLISAPEFVKVFPATDPAKVSSISCGS